MGIPQFKLLTRSSEDEEWESLNLSDPRAMQGLISGLQALGVSKVLIGQDIEIFLGEGEPEDFRPINAIQFYN